MTRPASVAALPLRAVAFVRKQARWSISVVAVSWAIAVFIHAALAASSSSLDPRFGSGGKVKTQLTGSASVAALLPQRDDRILVAGSMENGDDSSAIALARYRPNGALDRTFGSGGRTITRVPGAERGGGVRVVVRRADGKLVAGGFASIDDLNVGFLLARYDRRGRLDRSFGTNGLVTTGFAGVERVETSITALQLRQDGGVFAAGPAFDRPFDGMARKVAMARYTANGRLDTTFGNAGTLLVDFIPGYVESVAIGRDGGVVAVGSVGSSTERDFAVVRFKPDGSRDLGFGNEGAVIIDFGAYDVAKAAAIARDGSVVVFGLRILCLQGPEEEECSSRAVGARLQRDGRLDAGFGQGGRVSLSSLKDSAHPDALAIAANGSIAVAGNIWRLGKTEYISLLLLAVYRKDGTLDRRLRSEEPGAPAGVAVTDFTGRGFERSGDANAVAWDRKGKILAAGDAAGKFAVARYRLLPH